MTFEDDFNPSFGKKTKKPRGRSPQNEELAANRSRYGRSGYENSKKAYSRKSRNGKSKRQQWSTFEE